MTTEIFLGSESRNAILDNLPDADFILIDHDPPRIPYAKRFDVSLHSFNPLSLRDYAADCDFTDIIGALFQGGQSTLTREEGLEFIAERLQDRKVHYLDHLIPEPDNKASKGHIWAYQKIQRLLRSPVLNSVLCNPSHTKFSFNPRSVVVVRIDRAELRSFVAEALVFFLIRQFQGQIVIPSFAPYARAYHRDLLSQRRLIAGIKRLKQLPPQLESDLDIEDITPAHTTYDDADTLARYSRFVPHQEGFVTEVQRLMGIIQA